MWIVPPPSSDHMQLNSKTPLSQQLKTLQIIRAAVIAGPLFFFPIALFANSKPLNFQVGILETLDLIMICSIGIAWVFVGKINFLKNIDLLKSMAPDERDNTLAGIRVKQEIIRGALLEGPTFFSFILIMISGSLLGLTAGLLLTILSLALFPTRNRFLNQIEALKFNLGL